MEKKVEITNTSKLWKLEIINQVKEKLFKELEDKSNIYAQSFQYYTIEQRPQAISKLINKEAEFMDNIIKSICLKVSACKDVNNTVILWDIDDTLTRSRWKIIRDSFKFIHEAIHNLFPGIEFGICSARWKEHINEEFYPLYDNYFNKDYIFSSRNDSYDLWGNDRETWWEITGMAYINKINAYNRITKENPDKEFILIDDMIDEKFEELKHWIAIPDQSQHLLFLIRENIIDSFM